MLNFYKSYTYLSRLSCLCNFFYMAMALWWLIILLSVIDYLSSVEMEILLYYIIYSIYEKCSWQRALVSYSSSSYPKTIADEQEVHYRKLHLNLTRNLRDRWEHSLTKNILLSCLVVKYHYRNYSRTTTND